MLAYSLRRDRLAELDCRLNVNGEVERLRDLLYARSGASSVKNGPRKVLSVAFPTRGLLILSTSADTPNTSENRVNCRLGVVGVSPMRVRNSIPLFHSSVVILREPDEKYGKGVPRKTFMNSMDGDRRCTHLVSVTNS